MPFKGALLVEASKKKIYRHDHMSALIVNRLSVMQVLAMKWKAAPFRTL